MNIQKGVDRSMGKKHVNASKGAAFQSSKGRRPSQPDSFFNRLFANRERNVGHSKEEEHSRVTKGSKGNRK